jgi:chemotaxis protein methyltransferase CheR
VLAALAEMVVRDLGLRCAGEPWGDLVHALERAAADLDLDNVADCARRLLSGQASPEVLARYLTNGETYFFREPATLDILRNEVLPELAKVRGDRTLRIWSAGCATGEEACTLAMILEEVFVDLDQRPVTLLGTDINTNFLRCADKGAYRPWSFRHTPAQISERFFHRAADGCFEIARRVHRRVTFAPLNLVADAYPLPAMDIILCRNVLMYFDSVCARNVVRRLLAALTEGGYLVVGANEVALPLFDGFEPVRRSGAVLYRKPMPPTAIPFARPTASTTPSPARSSDPYSIACDLFKQGLYADALEAAMECHRMAPGDEKTLILLTRIHANSGARPDALLWSQRDLAANKLNPVTHYTHAMILVELDRHADAARALATVLYLAPNHALAHYTLGVMAYRNRESAKARRYLDRARAILAQRPPGETVDEIDGLTNAELSEFVHRMHALLERQKDAA